MRSARSLSIAVMLGGSLTAAAVAAATPAAASGSWSGFAVQPMVVGSATAPAPNPVAGYLPSVSASAQTVSSKFKVAAVTCVSGNVGTLSTVIGIGSTTAPGFIGGYLESGCQGTTPYYRAAAVNAKGPIGPAVDVLAGHLISVSVNAGASPKATLTDVTSGAISSGSVAAFTADTAQLTLQATGTPFPTFRSFAFSGAKVGGTSLGALNAQHYNQVSQAGNIQLKSSRATSRGNFTVKYVSQG